MSYRVSRIQRASREIKSESEHLIRLCERITDESLTYELWKQILDASFKCATLGFEIKDTIAYMGFDKPPKEQST